MTNTMKRLAVLLIGTLFVLCVAIVLAVSLPVSTAFAAEGEPEATVHDHNDGTWTAITADGGTLESGNYYLAGDVTLTTDITIADNATVTLCLNGYTLTGARTNAVITFNEGVDFTLEDCSADASAPAGRGVITGGIGFLDEYSARHGGGVYISGNSTFTMNGGTISGNTANNGGGVGVDNDGTFTMNGGTISGNTANFDGGGVGVDNDGTFTMNGGTISGNSAYDWGGGVYVRNNSTFTMEGGTITDNTAKTFGGGVYVAYGTFTMTGGTISNNSAVYNDDGGNGGGVGVNNYGTFTMNGGTISGNTATVGGGVGVDNYGTFTMNGGTISDNTANYGGGVYVHSSTFTMSGGTISDNMASGNGGGVSVYGTFTMNGGTIAGNTTDLSYGYGGGVCLISNASLELNGSIVNNSTATGSNPGNGGGIYCGSGCSLTLNSSITGNKAYGQGGGTAVFNNVYALNSKITFNANALSSVQQNSIVLNTSSCTLADGKWKTDQIGPYFELQDGGEIIIAGGYYSTDPAQQFTIADTARVVQIDENSGDNNYEAAYPWAVYPVNFEYMSGRQNGSLVYDGQPIEKDTDFTLYLESSHDMPFNYWYKAQGANDSAYVLGLPADAGTYTVKVGALYLKGSYKEYWECTFDVTIAKADYVMSGVTFDGGSFTYDGENCGYSPRRRYRDV